MIDILQLSQQEREREFLRGLTELSRRTGIEIGGCGCCGSPHLYEIPQPIPEEAGYADRDKVRWVSPQDEYEWKWYAEHIVR